MEQGEDYAVGVLNGIADANQHHAGFRAALLAGGCVVLGTATLVAS